MSEVSEGMSEDGLGVLCLGFSSIVQRRVLPALESLPQVKRIEIGSRRGRPDGTLLTPKVGRCFDDFTTALATSDCDLVYVSTVNSEHAEWVERALESDFHTVVDKPSFIDPEDGERLLRRAAKLGLCLAEATVYTAHPQIELCRRIFAQTNSSPTRISTLFSMPPLASDNFRYRRQLGGGALWDLGPYAVSLGRIFFDDSPDTVHCEVLSADGADQVETAFSAQLQYPGGRSLVGHFGFDTEYRNEATLLGPGAAIRVSRIFTTPPTLANELEVQVSNQASRPAAPSADSFACFLEDVLERIRSGGDRMLELGQNLGHDLRVLTALRRATETAAKTCH